MNSAFRQEVILKELSLNHWNFIRGNWGQVGSFDGVPVGLWIISNLCYSLRRFVYIPFSL